MSITKIEYNNFLKKEFSNLNDHEKTISNIILDNIDLIRSKRSANGLRNKIVSELVEQNSNRLIIEEKFQENEFDSNVNSFSTIEELSVQDFRGFRHAEEFCLSKDYTFIYGPNGSGKSSFCEALEYSLLGSIAEANKKRIKTEDYIKNIDSNRSSFPTLTGKYEEKIVEIQPSPTLYEFCFIERNRIEGFSRITANSPKVRQEQLSALLGLDDFNQFVSEFSGSIEDYIDCVGVKSETLEEKRETLKFTETRIEELNDEKLIIDNDKSEILKTYSDIENLDKLDVFLNGNDEKSGEIKNIENEILSLSNNESIKSDKLSMAETCIDELIILIDQKNKKEKELIKFKTELKLSELYKSVLNSKNDYSDKCPACETPIFEKGQLMLARDPYANAESKIQELEFALLLEKEFENTIEEIEKLLKNLIIYSSEINEISKILNFQNKEELKAAQNSIRDLTIHNIHKVSTLTDYKNLLVTLVELSNQYISSMTESIEIKTVLTEKLKNLNHDKQMVAELKSKYENYNDKIKKYKSKLEKFEEDNDTLIKEVEQEKVIVEENIKFVNSYKSLIIKLKDYNEKLPGSLVGDISSLALDIYNMINKHDHEYDKLEDLILPSTSDQKILIKFTQGDPQDALLVLSEGHLRCLGLSILLAKNIKNDLPLLIFDDVVNAIDDEHRRGIIDTLLFHEDLQNKQIIITTHGAEFMKNLENRFRSVDVTRKLQRYNFRRLEDRKEINVSSGDYKNYLEKARGFLEVDDYTYCLDVCRKSLEQQVRSIWVNHKVKVSFMSNNGNIKEYTLARLTEQIIKGLESRNELQNIRNLLIKIRGTEENGNNQKFWNLLNAGVHEEIDREEFDRVDVMHVYKILVHLEALQENPKLEDVEINRIIK